MLSWGKEVLSRGGDRCVVHGGGVVQGEVLSRGRDVLFGGEVLSGGGRCCPGERCCSLLPPPSELNRMSDTRL